MYPEYIGMYFCLIIIIIMQTVIIVMIKKLMSSSHKDVMNSREYMSNEGISRYVICMKCEQKYSANKKMCPYCGTKR
ncbi:MAG: hypothetical protein K1W19_01885 [Lachnospiraceae bacterium]